MKPLAACVHHWRILSTPTAQGYYARCRHCHAERYLPVEPPPRKPHVQELRLRDRELAWDGWFRKLEWESGEGVLGRLRRNRRYERLHGTRI